LVLNNCIPILPQSVCNYWKATTLGQNSSLAAVALPQIKNKPAQEAGYDAADFAAIVREQQSMVFSLALHFLRDRALAEEIAQEAFLRLYRNLASIESSGHLIHWLRKVTWRLCIDEVRNRPAQKPVSLEEVAEPAARAPAGDLLLARRLRDLVSRLPETMRMTIILRYQEEMELSEIAEVLEVPLNTVKSRIQRALAILRARFNRGSGGCGYESV
jgi:RNA polymerase sigma-70 factor (ECF subfamily)